MNNRNSDKRKLAQNTILLYLRTIIVMFISLYVSRIILNALGVTDYGVFNAVGGIVGMLSLITMSLVAATQRYISFELGKKDGNPSKIFSLALGIHIFIAIVVLALAETLGIWFLNTYMNIPVERMVAANWVFQFSVVSFVISLLVVPYNAIIIAQERMGVFAVISIVEAFLKLLFAIILLYAFNDKLIFYAFSFALISLIVFVLNITYCKSNFSDCCNFELEVRSSAYKQIGGFVGWNFIGSTATVLSKQGVNVLLNVFCGVIVNAGRGVATQVDNAVNQFVNSFTTALRPQITKTYAAKEYKECFCLLNQGTKLVMYLILLFVLPLTLRTDYILTIWLKTVPEYAVLFTRLSFLIITMDALSTPLNFLMLAQGNIRNYQLTSGTLALSTFPLTWITLKLGMSPDVSYYILFILDIFRWILQLIFLKRLANLRVSLYLRESILPIVAVFLITVVLGLVLNNVIPETFFGLLVLASGTSIILGANILIFGLSDNERKTILAMIKKRN